MCPFLNVNICKSYLGFDKDSSDYSLTRIDGTKEKPRTLLTPTGRSILAFFKRDAEGRREHGNQRSPNDSFLICINFIKTISQLFTMFYKQVVFLHA